MEKKTNPLKQRWSEAKTKSFVLAYLDNEALWNTSCHSYSQKPEKEEAYQKLSRDFDLTVAEVKNKIRIFRTTYSQERKKEEMHSNYTPKLSWYNAMKNAFGEGKVKSFSKFKREPTSQSAIIKKEDHSSDGVQIEYDDVEYEDNEDNMREDPIDQHQLTNTSIIVEHYDDELEDVNFPNQNDKSAVVNVIKTSPSKQQPKVQFPSSNEMFLQSLCSSLDQLSDEKNMRARIEMQQVLYKIMYEKP